MGGGGGHVMYRGAYNVWGREKAYNVWGRHIMYGGGI